MYHRQSNVTNEAGLNQLQLKQAFSIPSPPKINATCNSERNKSIWSFSAKHDGTIVTSETTEYPNNTLFAKDI